MSFLTHPDTQSLQGAIVSNYPKVQTYGLALRPDVSYARKDHTQGPEVDVCRPIEDFLGFATSVVGAMVAVVQGVSVACLENVREKGCGCMWHVQCARRQFYSLGGIPLDMEALYEKVGTFHGTQAWEKGCVFVLEELVSVVGSASEKGQVVRGV